jgi:hypothetical protein
MMRSLFAAVVLFTGIAANAAPPQADQHEKSADNVDKVICKRFGETGSLVASKRICKTKREWERDRDALRAASNVSSCPGQINGLCGGN